MKKIFLYALLTIVLSSIGGQVQAKGNLTDHSDKKEITTEEYKESVGYKTVKMKRVDSEWSTSLDEINKKYIYDGKVYQIINGLPLVSMIINGEEQYAIYALPNDEIGATEFSEARLLQPGILPGNKYDPLAWHSKVEAFLICTTLSEGQSTPWFGVDSYNDGYAFHDALMGFYPTVIPGSPNEVTYTVDLETHGGDQDVSISVDSTYNFGYSTWVFLPSYKAEYANRVRWTIDSIPGSSISFETMYYVGFNIV